MAINEGRPVAPRPVVIHVITGLGDGGAEGALFRLVTNDDNYEHQVVSLLDTGKYGPMLEKQGIQVSCLNMQPGRFSIGGLWRLAKRIRQRRPAIVQTWMYHADLIGGLAAHLGGCHHVYWGIRHSNFEPGTVKRSTAWVVRLCAALSSVVPARIISCSEEAAQTHIRIGYPRNKVRIIPNGYDLNLYVRNDDARRRLRQDWSADDGTFVIGMVARFDPQKDHENLLEALSLGLQAPTRLLCVLVGSGMDAGNVALNSWIASRGLQHQVRLLGRRSDVPDVMSAIDLHVLSSLGEAFPNVLAEAMACGTPCLTTRVGDAALIIGGTGWLVPARDPRALADSIIAAAQDHRDDIEAWHDRQRQCRQHIGANFTIQNMVQRYARAWSELARPTAA